MTNLAPLMSSDKQDWETPEEIVSIVEDFFGGRIDLDPCTTKENNTYAKQFFTPETDGLVRSWRGNVYVNPPYKEVKQWSCKCSLEASRANTTIVLLVPARTDTEWFQKNCAEHASAICFLRGRLKFSNSQNSAPFPSALVYYGNRPKRFRTFFGSFGLVVFP